MKLLKGRKINCKNLRQMPRRKGLGAMDNNIQRRSALQVLEGEDQRPQN